LDRDAETCTVKFMVMDKEEHKQTAVHKGQRWTLDRDAETCMVMFIDREEHKQINEHKMTQMRLK
jgi:hypothetical protein